jgi:peroxiredoxin
LECAGWFNGGPKPFEANGPAVHLVDVWSQWCPECQNLAASLHVLHGKYKDKNVQFVSVSDMSKKSVEKFMQTHSFSWPCGYGLNIDSIVRMGAVNTGMGARTPGYAIAPTIFVVGSDGKVRGSDNRARWRHRSKDEIVKQVAKLLDEALKEADQQGG